MSLNVAVRLVSRGQWKIIKKVYTGELDLEERSYT